MCRDCEGAACRRAEHVVRIGVAGGVGAVGGVDAVRPAVLDDAPGRAGVRRASRAVARLADLRAERGVERASPAGLVAVQHHRAHNQRADLPVVLGGCRDAGRRRRNLEPDGAVGRAREVNQDDPRIRDEVAARARGRLGAVNAGQRQYRRARGLVGPLALGVVRDAAGNAVGERKGPALALLVVEVGLVRRVARRLRRDRGPLAGPAQSVEPLADVHSAESDPRRRVEVVAADNDAADVGVVGGDGDHVRPERGVAVLREAERDGLRSGRRGAPRPARRELLRTRQDALDLVVVAGANRPDVATHCRARLRRDRDALAYLRAGNGGERVRVQVVGVREGVRRHLCAGVRAGGIADVVPARHGCAGASVRPLNAVAARAAGVRQRGGRACRPRPQRVGAALAPPRAHDARRQRHDHVDTRRRRSSHRAADDGARGVVVDAPRCRADADRALVALGCPVRGAEHQRDGRGGRGAARLEVHREPDDQTLGE